MLGFAKIEDPRLIIREIIVQVVQPMITIPQRHGQTVDRRTDDFYTMTIPRCAYSIAR